MTEFQPTLNALLNLTSIILLSLGYYHIKKKNESNHKKIMLSAVAVSALFLISYLIYHYNVGSVKYEHYDWTRPVYFAVLIPHVILSALMVPFIIYLLIKAFKQQFDLHRKFARILLPVWLFSAMTGIIVYIMLYLR